MLITSVFSKYYLGTFSNSRLVAKVDDLLTLTECRIKYYWKSVYMYFLLAGNKVPWEGSLKCFDVSVGSLKIAHLF